MWKKLFDSQAYNQFVYKNKKYPIYITKEFDFFRCVPFDESMYGIVAYDLFMNNLRESDGRYSKLFGKSKVSYWCNRPDVARAEVRKHKEAKNTLLFWAYDDFSSFVPCRENSDYLHILDARTTNIAELIEKVDKNIDIPEKERKYFEELMSQDIDAIAYLSKASDYGENFIFNERGFAKLALKWVRLRFCKLCGGSSSRIWVVTNGDYNPNLESYADYFLPKCRIRRNEEFLKTKEYLSLEKTYDYNFDLRLGRKAK